MALIPCKNCGKDVSDTAAQCPHCGELLQADTAVLVCQECGASLPDSAESCPRCGYRLQTSKDETAAKQPSKKKVIAAIVCLAVIAAALFFIGQRLHHEKDAAVYRENLELATSTMLSGAAEAETLGNLTTKVWRNSIHEESDPKTDKYTRPTGHWVDDFNEALGNLFRDSAFQDAVSSIEENQKRVFSIMKDLKDPPKDYEDAYDLIQTYYESYMTLTNLVIDPTGSLNTFSSNFSDADTECFSQFKAMNLYLEAS